MPNLETFLSAFDRLLTVILYLRLSPIELPAINLGDYRNMHSLLESFDRVQHHFSKLEGIAHEILLAFSDYEYGSVVRQVTPVLVPLKPAYAVGNITEKISEYWSAYDNVLSLCPCEVAPQLLMQSVRLPCDSRIIIATEELPRSRTGSNVKYLFLVETDSRGSHSLTVTPAHNLEKSILKTYVMYIKTQVE